jgi:TonB family protein
VKLDCERAEIVAGAIALGEATESERDLYRRHLASCPACCTHLVGERELERAAAAVAQARDGERWEPEISFHRIRAARSRRSALRVALSAGALAAAIALAAGLSFAPHGHRTPVPVAIASAHPAAPMVFKVAARARQIPQRHIVIVHNVVTLTAPAPTASARPRVISPPAAPVVPASAQSITAAARKKESMRVAQAPQPAVPESNVPIWRRYEPLPHTMPTQAPLSMQAESIEVAPISVIREVTPIGGESAINPQPPLIAYSERAEGTTAFDVNVDERGIPTKCTITKSSGYLSLDQAVCRAAMKARYYPKTINGRPVDGIYRDAFTFRESDEEPVF